MVVCKKCKHWKHWSAGDMGSGWECQHPSLYVIHTDYTSGRTYQESKYAYGSVPFYNVNGTCNLFEKSKNPFKGIF